MRLVNRTNGKTTTATITTYKPITTSEDIPCITEIRTKRTRPVQTATFTFILTVTASSRKENRIAVPSHEQVSSYAVIYRKSYSTIQNQFGQLCLGWHPPVFAPIGSGSIISSFKGGKIVICIVFGHYKLVFIKARFAIAPAIGNPIELILRFSFTPSKVVTKFFGSLCPYIADCPKCT